MHNYIYVIPHYDPVMVLRFVILVTDLPVCVTVSNDQLAAVLPCSFTKDGWMDEAHIFGNFSSLTFQFISNLPSFLAVSQVSKLSKLLINNVPGISMTSIMYCNT